MPTAVVTGAAGGIGAAIAARMRRDGWRVHGLDLHWPDGIASADDLTVDLRDTPALEESLSALGDVDCLVNNAAVLWTTPIAESDIDAFDNLIAVNLRAPFVAMKALIAGLTRVHGAVINVSSVHAMATSDNVAAYAASKGGLLALTRAAAIEFGPAVRVNAVVPGAIRTGMLREGLARDPQMASFLEARTPLRRVGEPEEVAEAVAFLADRKRSGFMTGEALVLDGGALARLGTE